MDKVVLLEKYKDFMENFPICTVDVILFDGNGNTLLFKRNYEPYKGNYFSLGGRLYKNEVPIDCAIRQLESEIGIKVNKGSLKFIGVLNEINPSSKFLGVNYHSVNLFYLLKIDRKEVIIKLDSQHSEYRWFNIEDPSINKLVKYKLNACGENND